MNGWDAFWSGVGAVLASGWGVPIRAAIVIIVAILLKAILKSVVQHTVKRIVAGFEAKEVAAAKRAEDGSPVPAARRIQRARSIGRILDNTISAAIAILAALLVVVTVWPEATTAFGLIAAGLGAGIGLGAQGVVRDVLNGVFFAVEDQLGIGDVVDLGEASGVVEDLGVRLTQVRDLNGALWFVPNGQILRVKNLSHGWARAVIDISVPYATDVDAARSAIAQAGAALAAEPAWAKRILSVPEIWGIESLAADAIVLRTVVRTTTQAQDDVARELRARIKAALDSSGAIVWPPTIVKLDKATDG